MGGGGGGGGGGLHVVYLTASTTDLSARNVLFVYQLGCLTFQKGRQGGSQGWTCSDNLTCCPTKIQVADQACNLISPE